MTIAPPVKLTNDAGLWKPAIDEIKIDDGRLRSVWGDRLWRIHLVAQAPPVRGQSRLGLEM
ncbi:MAG: hypothetical protein ACRD8O_13480 [Bryobacteraceae bacterium]